jgi:hypothetical protein
VLVEKPVVKRSVGRQIGRRFNNIMMDYGGMEWSVVYLIGLAQDRYQLSVNVNAAMTFRIP